jgi:hypothetical protein
MFTKWLEKIGIKWVKEDKWFSARKWWAWIVPAFLFVFLVGLINCQAAAG